MTASFTPTASGTYSFHITSDGASELWLADDGTVGGLHEIASVPSGGICEPGVFDKYHSQTSRPLVLTGGKAHMLRVLHKSGRAGSPHVDIRLTKVGGRVKVPMEFYGRISSEEA